MKLVFHTLCIRTRVACLAAIVVVALSASSVSAGVSIDVSRRLGLSADVLAVSGVSAVQADALMQRLLDASTERAQLTSAVSAIDAVLAQVGSLDAIIEQSGDSGLIAQRDTLVASIPAARETVRQASEALLTVALDGISSETALRVRRTVHRGGVRIPLALKVLDLPAATFDQVVRAVATEQVEHREGNDLSGNFDPTAFLAPFRNSAEATAAGASLAANRDAIKQVFATWAGRE